MVVGPQGGLVSVTSASSPLFGTQLLVPAGALTTNTEIRIFTPPAQPSSTTPPIDKLPDRALVLAEIQPSGTTFMVPAMLTLRYRDDDADCLVDGLGLPEGSLVGLATASETHAWRYYPASIDPAADVVTFEIEHLSEFGIGKVASLEPGVHKVFFDQGAPAPSQRNAFGPKESATVMAAMTSGPWQSLTECAGYRFERTMRREEASVVVSWQHEMPAGPLEPGTAAGTAVQSPAGEPIHPKLLSFNQDLQWGLEIATLPPSGPQHLHSVALHEFAHLLGLNGKQLVAGQTHLNAYASPEDLIVSPSKQKVWTSLGPNDADWFAWRHPVVFRDWTPTGGIGAGAPTIAITIEALCGKQPSLVTEIEMTVRQGLVGNQAKWRRLAPGGPITVVDELGGSIVHASWALPSILGRGGWLAEVRAVTSHVWPSAGQLGPSTDTKKWSFFVSECEGFPPPPGERSTFRVRGTSIQFTTETQAVAAPIDGHVVYRYHTEGDPPGLGLYIGCTQEHGEVDVATDTWDAADPLNQASWGRDSWSPPLYRVPLNGLIGESRLWSGRFGAADEQWYTQIQDYEFVTVPAGSFIAMKVLEEERDSAGQVIDATTFWIAPSVGVVKGEDSEGSVLELVSHSGGSLPVRGETACDLRRMVRSQWVRRLGPGGSSHR